jgi:large subunit ribosomal protein L22
MSVRRAETELNHLPKRSTGPILKLLKSAAANATHASPASMRDFFIKEIRVDSGPVLKRMRPRAFGRAATIRKRTSHISLVLESRRATEAADITDVRRTEEEKSRNRGAARRSAFFRRPFTVREKHDLKGRRRGGGVLRRMFQRKVI